MTRNRTHHDVETQPEKAEIDRESSAEAWRFVFGCWLLEGLMWGLPLSFGVFQAYYNQEPLFSSSKSIPTIGALATGFSNFGFPFISPICLRFPQYQRHLLIFGFSCCVLSLVVASSATQVWHLLLSQGVMYGVGWPICYTPMLLFTNAWFERKRGTVYGIIYSSSGIGGVALPFLLEGALQRWGFRVALRGTAIAMLVMAGPGLLYVKPPPIVAEQSPGSRFGNLKFLKNKVFYVFAAAAFLQGISFYMPRFFVPSYAHDLGLSHAQGATVLACYSIAQVIGQMGLGWLSDKVNIFIPVVLSTAVPAAVTFLVWGPAKGMASLISFSLLCGSFGAAFSVLWPRMSTYLADDSATSTLIFGIFIAERGLANLISGPISESLTGDQVDVNAYGLSKYTGVVVFVGVTSVASALSGVGYFIPRKREQSKDEAFEAAFAPLHEMDSLDSLLSDEDENKS